MGMDDILSVTVYCPDLSLYDRFNSADRSYFTGDFPALLMAVIYRSALRKLTRAQIWAGAQIGFFMFTGYAFQTRGLLLTTPSKAAFITGSGVVLVPVLMARFWGRRIHRWVWVGALAALVGLYYLTVPPAGLTQLNTGDLLVFVCAVLFARHIIFVGRYSPHHSVGALS